MEMYTFESWLREVDQHMVNIFGLAHDDLPDALWRDRFDDGLMPAEAIDAAVYDEWSDYFCRKGKIKPWIETND